MSIGTCVEGDVASGRHLSVIGPISSPLHLLTQPVHNMSLTSSASSYIDVPSAAELEEVDDLPSDSAGSSTSISPSDGDDDDDDEADTEMADEFVSDAEREWRESLQQLELLLTMVLMPYLGKYFGRRCAYWGELNFTLFLLFSSCSTSLAKSVWVVVFLADSEAGWARFMEWKYPVTVEVTNPAAFKGAGAVAAAASL